MQISGIPTWYAPQTTGHPLGLPEAQPRAAEKTRVVPITKRSDSNALSSEGRPPEQFWRATDGDSTPTDHVAPPSIMQIRISRMLEEQASTLQTEDASALPEPEDNAPVHTAEDAKAKGDSPSDDSMARDARPAPLALPAYEESASLSRNAVLSTLP